MLNSLLKSAGAESITCPVNTFAPATDADAVYDGGGDDQGRVGVDVDTVPCVEQRRCGRCGGVEELFRSSDSCCCCSRMGI